MFSPLNVPTPRATLEPGKTCFVRVGKDAKRPGCFIGRFVVAKDGRLHFGKDNPSFKPVVVVTEHVEQLAVAIEKRSKRV